MNLSDPACRNAFANECQGLAPQIAKKSASTIKRALLEAANRQLTSCGVPELGFAEDPRSTANGYFDFGPWSLTFGGAANEAARKTYGMLVSLANTAYHESRHCEQWFRIAQMGARGELPRRNMLPAVRADAAGMAADMGIALRAAQAAVANSDYRTSGVQRSAIEAWFTSIYGAHGTRRGDIYAFIATEYDRYRNLPEEQDAWRLGDTVGDAVTVALNVRDTYPSHHDWMILTYKRLKRRSSELKAVDQALSTYDASRTQQNKDALRVVFNAWYGTKTKGTIRNTLDAGGQGVVDQLDAFLRV